MNKSPLTPSIESMITLHADTAAMKTSLLKLKQKNYRVSMVSVGRSADCYCNIVNINCNSLSIASLVDFSMKINVDVFVMGLMRDRETLHNAEFAARKGFMVHAVLAEKLLDNEADWNNCFDGPPEVLMDWSRFRLTSSGS
jgi:hypothetical protein